LGGKINLLLIARKVVVAARRDSVYCDAVSAFAAERHPLHRSQVYPSLKASDTATARV
jgi:hypothetical protein